MPTMTSRRSLAAIVLCALCTCANLVPLGSGDWRLGPQGRDGRALDGVEERDAYIRALAVFFRRLSVSQVFHREIWEKEPRHWTPAETGIPRPHFGYANITAAAAAGMLGNSGDTYFTEQQGGHLCAGARDANGTVRRAGFFKINHRLALSGVQMTNAVLEEQFRSGATLSINKAGYVWDWIADICRAAMGALGMYTNVNLYATREGAAVAIPAHNDRQDVFILQLQGHKRWVLFKPVEPLPTYEQVPPLRGTGASVTGLQCTDELVPARGARCKLELRLTAVSRGRVCAQERGKDHGGPMAMEELSAEHKTHDLVLSPGDVLYVPRGYVHETSTVSDKYLDAHPSEARDTHSIALTLGIETATLSQTFENLLTCLAAKAQWHPAVGLDQAGQAVCVSLWHMLCSHASQWGLAQGVRGHERGEMACVLGVPI